MLVSSEIFDEFKEEEIDTNKTDRIEYRVVKDNEDKRLAIQVGNGYFQNFFFKINRLRLTYETEEGMIKSVNDWEEVKDKDINLDFEYDLSFVPKTYKQQEGDQEEFEQVTRQILIDVLMNRPELYAMEAFNEHQTDSEPAN